MTRQLTIDLPYDVAHRLEIQAALDDMRLKEGIEHFLTELVAGFEEQHPKIETDHGNGYGTPKERRFHADSR